MTWRKSACACAVKHPRELVLSMMVNPSYQIIQTCSNTDLVFYKNYVYTKPHVGKLFTSWRCQKRTCPAKIRTNLLDPMEIIFSTDDHNHVLSENDISKRFLSSKIQNIVKNTSYTTQQVYSVATSTSRLCDLPILNKNHIFKNIRNIRKRNSIVVDKTKSLQELNFRTLRNEPFCLYDSGVYESDRIVIFATERNMVYLKNSRFLIFDGTFKVCPNEFLQLYAIHGEINSKTFSLAFILMKSKKENDYIRAFSVLYEKCQQKLPDYVVIDFEIAAYVAFKKATKCQVYFCLFQLGQCHWRKIQKLGLSKEILHNQEFKLFMKTFSSLAFVPVDSIDTEYKRILKKASDFSEINLSGFLKNFKKIS